jgi:hypothetical protein
MDPGERYWSLVETVWDDVSIYDGGDTFLSQFNASPVTPRVLLAAHWCQSEILNGGLGQFFGNSTGVLAPEAVESYRAIGMPSVAELLEEAVAWFGSSYPRDQAEREKRLSDWERANPESPDPFARLEDKFVEALYSEAGGFEAAADAYALAHGG